MKKTFVLLTIFFVLCLFACKDNNLGTDAIDYSAINSPILLTTVGAKHNNALEVMGEDTTFTNSDTSETLRLFNTALSNIIVQDPLCDSVAVYGAVVDLAYYLVGKDIDSAMKAYYDNTLPTVDSNFSIQEMAIVEDAVNFIYNYNFTGLTISQAYNVINNKADSLLTVYNAIDWDTVSSSSYMKGEMAGGLLYILKSSSQFWSENLPTTTTTNGFVIIIEADAVGYLTGWLNAVVSEVRQNGHLNINNSNKRINAGIDGAIVGSTIGGLLGARNWWSKRGK